MKKNIVWGCHEHRTLLWDPVSGIFLEKSYGFSSSHVWMWELDYKESWAPKNWCFWTVVLEKTLESPLDCKEIQPLHPEGNQSWIVIGRTDAEAETPILWPADAKNWLLGKDPEAGKDWRQEEKATTEDEMAGWHHRLEGHEFEQALGVGDGQGSLACCSPWGCKELDTTERLNWSLWNLLPITLTAASSSTMTICHAFIILSGFLDCSLSKPIVPHTTLRVTHVIWLSWSRVSLSFNSLAQSP